MSEQEKKIKELINKTLNKNNSVLDKVALLKFITKKNNKSVASAILKTIKKKN